MSIKHCVNCPGRTDHDTADCPVMHYGTLDPQQRLDVARGTGDKVLIEREVLEACDRVNSPPPIWAVEKIRALLSEQPQASAAWQRTQSAGVPEGWRLVPVEPTEEMWSGLARHLMMWLDFGNPTVEALRKHLDMLNIEWPAWMDAESELQGSGVPSKGTRATLIYKAMLAAAPAQPAAHDQGEVQRLHGMIRAIFSTRDAWLAPGGRRWGLVCDPKMTTEELLAEIAALAASTGQEQKEG